MANRRDDRMGMRRGEERIWRDVMALVLPYRLNYLVTLGVIVLLAGVEVLFPLVVRHAIDSGIVLGDRRVMYRSVGMYVGLIVVQSLLVAVFIAQCGRVGARVLSDLRKRMFGHLQALSVSYFDRTPVGWIMSRMFSDSQRVGETVTWGAVDSVWGFVNMVLMAVAMVYVQWQLALAVLALMPPIILISIVFQKRILHTYREVRRINSEVTAGYSEGFSGFSVIKTLGRERAMADEFSGVTGALFRASFRSAVLGSMYLPIIHVIGALGSAAVIAWGGHGVVAGSMTLGTLVAFVSYTRRFFDPANEIARVLGQLQETRASAERMFSLLAAQPQVLERSDAVDGGLVRGAVLFERVSFGYDRKRPVLEHFTLDVKPGETLALVGPTGSGKSTVISLLMRFYDPDRGRVMIDGEDIRTWTFRKLRSNMGIVLQTPHLFSGTVMENLRYGRLEADDSEVLRASQMTGLHDFIQVLPEQYETKLKEGGEPLSAGQKQLVSLTRAVLVNPPILIMDEATSSIDMQTEQQIQEACEVLLANRTAFIIAHRLTTIRRADRILVIHNGRIIEVGSHDELVNRRGFYHRLYLQQFMSE